MPMEHFQIEPYSLLSMQTELFQYVQTFRSMCCWSSHGGQFGNVQLGIQLLLQNGTAFDTVFGCGVVKEVLNFCRSIQNFDFEEQRLKETI
jgi:hypothetical protein